jgi:hypothetical protein
MGHRRQAPPPAPSPPKVGYTGYMPGQRGSEPATVKVTAVTSVTRARQTKRCNSLGTDSSQVTRHTWAPIPDSDAPDSAAQTMSPARSRWRGFLRPGRLPSPPIEARMTFGREAGEALNRRDRLYSRPTSIARAQIPVSAGHSCMRRVRDVVHDHSPMLFMGGVYERIHDDDLRAFFPRDPGTGEGNETTCSLTTEATSPAASDGEQAPSAPAAT